MFFFPLLPFALRGLVNSIIIIPGELFIVKIYLKIKKLFAGSSKRLKSRPVLVHISSRCTQIELDAAS
jgi:hypothetical protein